MQLTVIKYDFTVHFHNDIHFKKFSAASIRGALGYELKRMNCVAPPGKRICKDCILSKQCVYTNLWEPNLAVDPQSIPPSMKYIPHPFIIDSPFYDTYFLLKKNTAFNFSISLIGNKIMYFPHIVLTVEKMSRRGLGYKRITFDIDEISTVIKGKPHTVYKDGKIHLHENINSFDLTNRPKNVSKIAIHFLSPCRLKKNGKYLRYFDWETFLKRLMHRYSMLNHFFMDNKTDFDIRILLNSVSDINARILNMEWKDFRRRSTRQDKWMTFSGFTGEIELEGKLNEYIELLEAGEMIHVGKNTTFGLGKYRLN